LWTIKLIYINSKPLLGIYYTVEWTINGQLILYIVKSSHFAYKANK
jgi:hypothetical protein